MKRVLNVFVIGALILGQLVLAAPMPAKALSGSDFRPGRIIDDSLFFTPSEMSAGDIQNFLNSKVPSCDTNGTTMIYDSSRGDTVTRAVYSQRRGYSPPFTCLKDFRQDVPNQSASSGLCNGMSAGNKSGAQIIYEVAQSCSISAKVLLVLLQKEQGLVTDTWPWPMQYRSATGYGCPDSANCDANYYGFFNQVYSAAWQFKKYAQSPTSFGYRAGRTNYILWNPNAGACGGSDVFIENQATAGLYNYTPYRPNAAALNNLYGTGDSCSAYGNRNFWRYYSDWFGSTLGGDPCYNVANAWNEYAKRMVDGKGYHFYTNNPKEECVADKLVGYRVEDQAGYKVSSYQVANTAPLFKLSNDRTGDHFYTTSTVERDIARDVVRYRDELVAFYVYPTQQAGTIPVYRLTGRNGDHFYTTSTVERDAAKNQVHYTDEGIAFYVAQ